MSGEGIRVIRLPAMFFDDHQERFLPTPVVQRRNSRSVWIREDDPELPELISDADYYASEGRAGAFDEMYLSRAAERLLAAIERAGIRWRKLGAPTYGIEIITGEES